MKTQSMRRILFPCLLAAVLFLAPGLASKPGQPTNGHVFSLQAPSFVGIANAEEDSVDSIIEDEAGIAAYFQSAIGINLNDVRDIFRTIEVETADYIIGSVPVPNHDETHDVHVYVHVDGWVLAYYMAGDPAAKILDWRVYHDTGRSGITTKLENTLAVVAGEAGVPFPGATYYHFRYPNATRLILIVEWVYEGTDVFQVKLPGSFAYCERSWALGTVGSSSSMSGSYKVDGVQIQRHDSHSGWWMSYGTLTVSQMLPDQYHTIELWAEDWYSSHYGYGYAGLTLVYWVP